VVEDVVGFQAKLDIDTSILHEREVLVELKIGVVVARAIKEVAAHISEGADRLGRKIRSVEVLMICGCVARIHLLEIEIAEVGSIAAAIVGESIAPSRPVRA